MAYLHCHSCEWSQDDFWSLRYNPITKMWSDIKWLFIPRIIELDEWVVRDSVEYTGIPVYKLRDDQLQPRRIFSWNWFILEAVREWKISRKMKWWTWESWIRDKDSAVCPACGNHNFDID